MTTYPAPMCLDCQRLRNREERKCEAFPGGIPEVIWFEADDHRRAWPGDHGLQFEPVDAEALSRVERVWGR